MVSNTKISKKHKTILYSKATKLRSFLQKKLKNAVENYSNTPEKLDEFDKIGTKLASLDLKNKHANIDGIERLKKYIEDTNMRPNSSILEKLSENNQIYKNSEIPKFKDFNPSMFLQKNIKENITTDRFLNYFQNTQISESAFHITSMDQIENNIFIKSIQNENSKIQNQINLNKSGYLNEDKKISKRNIMPVFIEGEQIMDTEEQEQVVEDRIDEIRKTLRNNQVLLVQGNTGCGKTTKIPRLLMNEYANIACSQPRRLAAINVANKVASDLKCSVGTIIGYSVRFEDCTSKQTRLRFLTDGVLVNEITSRNYKDNKKFGGYDLIIIDEAHERSVNIDYILGCFKRYMLSGFTDTKLLIMSATINSEKFAQFFNSPVISIKHKIFPIKYYYLKEDIEDYLSACIFTTLNIVKSNESGDILVFLTGQDEIEKAHQIISNNISNTGIQVLKLYSTMPIEEQDLVFKIQTRKIILSTNIAETSITIENVKFVIDSGKFKCKSHSNTSPINYLEVLDISQAQANQRAGRAGRTHPGIVYRIYTHEKYLSLTVNPDPEILRTRLSSIVLSMKSLGIHDVYNFDYIDKPSVESLKSAEEALYYLKTIDFDGLITRLGRKIAKWPMPPEMAVCLYSADRLGCLNSVATIAAFLEYQTPFLDIRSDSPFYGKYKYVTKSYSHPKGEFYSFLNIYRDWEISNFSFEFLKRKFLSINTMIQIRKIRTQLLSFFKESTDTSLNIEEAFCTGFFMNIAKIDTEGYRTILGDIKCFIHPKDNLYKSNAELILFIELQCSNRKYMRHCLEINPYILRLYSNIGFKNNNDKYSRNINMHF